MNKTWTDISKGMNNLADRIAGLSPAKRALIELRLKKKELVASGEQRIPQREKRSSAPLSFAQQRLWFLNQLGTGSAYNIPLAIRLKGLPNIKALEDSLNEIIRRHEALRTTFRSIGGRPVQVIAENVSLEMPLIDLSGQPRAEREVEAERLIRDEAMRCFDLVKGPLFNAALIRLYEEEHILLLTMHHIVSDGWSMGIFTAELATLYKAFCNGEASPLPELPIQYADFAHWQRVWLQGEVLENQLSYWRNQLEGVPALQLFTDRPRPSVQTFAGASQNIALSPTLTGALNDLSQRQGVTLFITLLSAFQTLLFRYTGQEDIVVGTPIANRNRTEIEGLIGFFVNSLAMRTDFSGNPSFLELVGRVREVAFGAFEHQDLPFEKLVEELHPERDISRTPLFQIMFAIQNMPAEKLQLPGLTLSSFAIEHITVRFDIEIRLWEKPEGLSGRVVYNTDLFDDATIARLMRHYETLLESIVADPNQRISDVQILTDTEHQQLLIDWNDTSSGYPNDHCVHQLYEQQVEQIPGAVAVVHGDEQLTYRELNARANQLAHYLKKLGIGPEVFVGICLERSLEMVIALMGILKAGGAYVPLDPEYPQERLGFMLADTGSPVLLTHSRLVEELPRHEAKVICIDSDWDAIARHSGETPVSATSVENLAYVIYTSGSTGKPKGVAISHGGLLNLVFWHRNVFEVTALDRATQLAGTAFDASVWEVWPYLTAGARLHVVSAEKLVSPEQLRDWLVSEEITLTFLPTPLAEQVLKLDWPQQTPLRTLLTGGDTLHRSPPESIPFKVVNNYGPTENTVVTTSGVVLPNSDADIQPPIGCPISNTKVYVLDEQLRPVPVGVPGELCIGGESLARGYLNRPNLTAENFIPNPYSDTPGARLYKSGDLVRYLQDGSIEFLGRIDHQVKIRGFRIELGEVESMLGRHPAAEEAVVIAHEDVPGDKRLVAYVVANPEPLARDKEGTGSKWEAEHISQWQKLYNDTYDQTTSQEDATFNIIGWNSSYTGQPILEEEMREWTDNTVEQILRLQPKRVLEIGCGTGLLLFRLASHCKQYWGTDFSQVAIDYIQQQLKDSDQALSDVALFLRDADNFEGLEAESFDTIILNSVVQYFPDIHYLLSVLERAVNVLKPGGSIFIGDVRHLGLLEAFHASVQLHRADRSQSTAQLQQRVNRQIVTENELVIDPAFFIALQEHLPKISRVEIMPKRGRYQNELTRFRYQVIIHAGPEEDRPADISWLVWQREKLSLSALRELLIEEEPEVLGIHRVPNARVQQAVETVKLLAGEGGLQTAGEVQEALGKIDERSVVDPEDIWDLSREISYSVNISWLDCGEEGSYDVVFVKQERERVSFYRRPCFAGETLKSRTWRNYANTPGQKLLASELVPQLRSFLQGKLPDYMVPSLFVLLDSMPLTPNGKVDRQALPSPDGARPEMTESFVAPRTPAEEVLARIWGEILKIEKVGIQDNFFELGGHSLLVVQIVSRIREVFEVELPLRALFEAPTVAGLTERIEAARRSDEGLQTSPLQAVSRDQDLPLSFAQERLWFLHHLEPDSVAYSMPRSIRLKGALRKDALEKTYVELARRHETLRTTFHSTDGNPVLRIAAEPNILFDTVDLRHLPGMEREAEAKRLSAEDARNPFDLTRGPLFRIRLFQLEDQEHVLYFNMHHIISDGWSSGVMEREIAALYTAFIQDKPADLPELPVQYADYAVWQRRWLQGEALEAQLNYWKDKLGGELPVLELPTDRPRPAVQTHRGAIESFALSKELTDALQAMSRREGVTLFMTLLAAFKTLLYRVTGQAEIIVGTPIAGRNRTELEGLIGFFMNTIVMRTDLSAQPSFRELLGRVRETALGAYAHQDMPFERLVEELSPERDLSRTPLFQVFFNHIVAMGNKAAELPGLEAEAVGGLEDRESKFDMTLYVLEGEGGIKLRLVYNTDLFDASTITWMLAHFETLLEGIADEPDQCISVLPLLTGTTRQQLSTKGNTIQPTKSFARIKAAEIDQSLQGRFMQQVKAYPDNIAVKTRKYEWTYEELNLEANRIAKRILTESGDKEERIALLLGHDAPMIASLFGALKSGKTYVPLDPSYPVERLAYILEDSNAVAVLTDSINLELAEALTRKKVQLINIDDKQSAQSVENVDVSITPDALAYILYTSGSTGFPKGVMQNHRNVMHFIRVYTNNLHISEDDRLTLISSYSFDGAIMDIFGALLNGSTLYPINIKEETAESILQWLINQEISIYHSTPTVYRYLLSSLDIHKKFPKIRLVVLGGEEVFRQDVELYKKHFEPDSIFINGLGPSESTVTLQYLINGHTGISRSAVPVGYPVEETEILLLNDAGEEAEVYGEISIRSPHIALGYWQKPDLTNKVFLPDPEEEDKKTYRSGDMGRLLPDGSIEFAGRKDFQVKIRGFRIEVGEIEVVLGQHPAVEEAVAIAREDVPGDKQLVAYVVASHEATPTFSEMRSFLKDKLPDYMIPTAFGYLDFLPLTPNGKIDRRALPAPDVVRPEFQQAFVAPRSQSEELVAGIWGNVLGLERIGVHDNFFELGGHSLLATRVVSRIQQEFNVDLKLMHFFKMPTIAELAKGIEGLLRINVGRPNDDEAKSQDWEEIVV